MSLTVCLWDRCLHSCGFIESTLSYCTKETPAAVNSCLHLCLHFSQMEELIEGIRWAFIDMLQKENDWMDKPTKQKAVEKASTTYPKMNFSNTYLSLGPKSAQELVDNCLVIHHCRGALL